jgi:hypothetical protein
MSVANAGAALIRYGGDESGPGAPSPLAGIGSTGNPARRQASKPPRSANAR